MWVLLRILHACVTYLSMYHVHFYNTVHTHHTFEKQPVDTRSQSASWTHRPRNHVRTAEVYMHLVCEDGDGHKNVSTRSIGLRLRTCMASLRASCACGLLERVRTLPRSLGQTLLETFAGHIYRSALAPCIKYCCRCCQTVSLSTPFSSFFR